MRPVHLVGELPPTDKRCGWCDELIRPGEFAPIRGTPMHYYCAVRGVVGSLDHLTRGPHEEGKCLQDDPRLTKREAALRSYRWWRARQEALRWVLGSRRRASTAIRRGPSGAGKKPSVSPGLSRG